MPGKRKSASSWQPDEKAAKKIFLEAFSNSCSSKNSDEKEGDSAVVSSKEKDEGVSVKRNKSKKEGGGDMTVKKNKTEKEKGDKTVKKNKTEKEGGNKTVKKNKTEKEGGETTVKKNKTEKEGGETTVKTNKTEKEGGETTVKKNKTTTDWSGEDWTLSSLTKPWNIKLASWNVDGLRACVGKGGADLLEHESPDVLCLQEIKVGEEKLPQEMKNIKEFPYTYWLAAEKDGYSGVGLVSKTEPLSVKFGFQGGDEGDQHNSEGRLITAEYPSFYLVTTYVPNAGRKLVTLDKRMEWDPLFRQHVTELDKVKPVIICGDMNVAHQEVDLKNPKTNKKNAGFTMEERDGFSELLEQGFVDTFRHLNPDKKDAFTFWTYMMNCRAKNVGWRLDYFLVSTRLMDSVVDSVIRDKVFGSDHCPITLLLNVKD